MRTPYMKDCMHLHACRRLCKICKIQNRGCTEKCTAYESEEDYVPVENVCEYVKENYYPEHVYSDSELQDAMGELGLG